MEYLDIYDENGNFLGKEDRKIVHENALWHKTVHAWLYDKEGHIYFQIRADEGTLYTTASGHLSSGESVEDAFAREIFEEIGLKIDASDAVKVDVVKYIMDREKADGSLFRDRAFSNIYIDDFEGDISEFNFDQSEVEGVVKFKVEDVLNLFKGNLSRINGIKIINNGQENIALNKEFTTNDFLVCEGETALEKYGSILNKIIEVTSKRK